MAIRLEYMRSLAIQPEKELDPCCSAPMECCHKREPYYPSLYIDAEQMPELNAMDVGEEYIITFRVKPCSLNKRDTLEEGVRSSGELRLLAYELKNAPKEDGDDDDGKKDNDNDGD